MERLFSLDSRFRNSLVFKTPFRNDVARVYVRKDERVVIQHLGVFLPLAVPGKTPVSTMFEQVSEVLDNWDAHTKAS